MKICFLGLSAVLIDLPRGVGLGRAPDRATALLREGNFGRAPGPPLYSSRGNDDTTTSQFLTRVYLSSSASGPILQADGRMWWGRGVGYWPRHDRAPKPSNAIESPCAVGRQLSAFLSE
jgi:hypothetical protein